MTDLAESIQGNILRVAPITRSGSYLGFMMGHHSEYASPLNLRDEIKVASRAFLSTSVDSNTPFDHIRQMMGSLPLVGSTAMFQAKDFYLFTDFLPVDGEIKDPTRTIGYTVRKYDGAKIVGTEFIDCTPAVPRIRVTRRLVDSANIVVPDYDGKVRRSEDGKVRMVGKYDLEGSFSSKDQIMASPILRGALRDEEGLEALASMLKGVRSGRIDLKHPKAQYNHGLTAPAIYGRDIVGLTLDLDNPIEGSSENPSWSIRLMKN